MQLPLGSDPHTDILRQTHAALIARFGRIGRQHAADIDERHLLMKRLGQTLCRPFSMACALCPLQPDCVTGQRSKASGDHPHTALGSRT